MYIVSCRLPKTNVFKHLAKKTGLGKQPIAIAVLNKQNTISFLVFYMYSDTECLIFLLQMRHHLAVLRYKLLSERVSMTSLSSTIADKD